jgi:hypothetical protein
MSKKEKDDDYIIDFKGAKLNKRQANSVGFAIIFGILGSLVLLCTPIAKNKAISGCILIVLAIIGLYLGNKLFSKK